MNPTDENRSRRMRVPRLPADDRQIVQRAVELQELEDDLEAIISARSTRTGIHELARMIAGTLPFADIRQRLRVSYLAQCRELPGRVFGTRDQWAGVGATVDDDAVPITVPASASGWQAEWTRRPSDGRNVLGLRRLEARYLTSIDLFEMSQTDRPAAVKPAPLGEFAAEMVSGARIRLALREFCGTAIRPVGAVAVRTPSGRINGLAIEDATVDVAATLVRAEVWSLEPDPDPALQLRSLQHQANKRGAVTELILARASALAIPLTEGFRDLGGDPIARPQPRSSAHTEARTQPVIDPYAFGVGNHVLHAVDDRGITPTL